QGGVLRAPAPTGLRPPAQGWRAAPTLGNGNRFINPNGVAALVAAWPAHGHNPFRVDIIMPALSQGRRRANPGLEDAAPLGQGRRSPPAAHHLVLDRRAKSCLRPSAADGAVRAPAPRRPSFCFTQWTSLPMVPVNVLLNCH